MDKANKQPTGMDAPWRQMYDSVLVRKYDRRFLISTGKVENYQRKFRPSMTLIMLKQRNGINWLNAS
jgi:hypothetical protein